jgi:hypothetical protein
MRKINLKQYPNKTNNSFLLGQERNGIVVRRLKATGPTREGASNYVAILEDQTYGGKRRAAPYNKVYNALTQGRSFDDAYVDGTYVRRSRSKQYASA